MNSAKKMLSEFKVLRGRGVNSVCVWAIVFLLLLGGTSSAATLYAQYRADTGLLMNTGNVVTQWVDAAGTVADLDRVIGEPKRLALGNSNSTARTVARFDGFDAIWSASKDFGSVGGDRTVVAHLRLNDGEDGFLFDGSTFTGMTRSQVASGEWQVGIQPENASNQDPVTAAATTNVWQTHVFEYDYEARGFLDWDKYYIVSHYIDGVLQGRSEIGENVDLSGFILSANVRGEEFLHCDVAEVRVYDNLMDEAQRVEIVNDIDARWGGLYDLPATYQSATVIQSNRNIVPFGIHDIATLAVETEGTRDRFSITNLTYNFNGTERLGDISELRVYTSGSRADFDPMHSRLLAQSTNVTQDSANFSVDDQLEAGMNYIHLTAVISDDAIEGNVLDAEIESFQLDGTASGTYTPDQTAPDGQITIATGFYMTAIRRQGDDGVNTYRIPGMVTTTNGSLIAIFDIRNDSSGDLPGNIDVGIMRSTDGGASWGAMKTIMDYDKNVDGSSGNGVGDPSILVDRETGRIWAAALWSFGNNGWSGSGPGLTPKETGQYVLCYSDDDGETWSEPSSITETVKNPDWNLFFQGPGKGFMTREGVLIFPSQFKDASGVPHSNFIWSDDHGESWHRAPPAIPSGNPQTTEAQIVELDSGDLLISMRNHDARNERMWCVYSWDHETETIADGSWGTPWFAQHDPTCMASVEAARSTRSGSPYEVLVFSNPDNTSSRVDMTIRASFDHGRTWPYRHKIDDRPSAYSCMTILPNGDIGILYETGDAHAYETLTFARFPLEWVTGNADGDGDGIPDHFEDATGLDKTNPEDAEIDSDSDGGSNFQEYMAKTHPGSADSKLELRAWINGIQPHLQFQSVPYMDYRIEYSSDLVSWETLPGYSGISGQGSLITVEPDSSTAPCYYRIRVDN